MSILNESIKYLEQTSLNIILQTDLLHAVSNTTGFSLESVRGNAIGFGKHRLMGSEYFQNNWVFCRGPARFVRKGFENKTQVYKLNYNTPNKIQARNVIFQKLRFSKKPRILTMAGERGYCIRQAKKLFDSPTFTNVEYDGRVLEVFKKTKLTKNNYHGNIGDYLKENPTNKFDLIYYDSISYACGYMHRDFCFINKHKNTKYLAITLLGIKNFRGGGGGEFYQWATKKFKKYNDPTLQWLKYVLSNYNMVENFYYSRDPQNHSRRMRVVIFKRKTQNEICRRKSKNRETNRNIYKQKSP